MSDIRPVVLRFVDIGTKAYVVTRLIWGFMDTQQTELVCKILLEPVGPTMLM